MDELDLVKSLLDPYDSQKKKLETNPEDFFADYQFDKPTEKKKKGYETTAPRNPFNRDNVIVDIPKAKAYDKRYQEDILGKDLTPLYDKEGKPNGVYEGKKLLEFTSTHNLNLDDIVKIAKGDNSYGEKLGKDNIDWIKSKVIADGDELSYTDDIKDVLVGTSDNPSMRARESQAWMLYGGGKDKVKVEQPKKEETKRTAWSLIEEALNPFIYSYNEKWHEERRKPTYEGGKYGEEVNNIVMSSLIKDPNSNKYNIKDVKTLDSLQQVNIKMFNDYALRHFGNQEKSNKFYQQIGLKIDGGEKQNIVSEGTLTNFNAVVPMWLHNSLNSFLFGDEWNPMDQQVINHFINTQNYLENMKNLRSYGHDTIDFDKATDTGSFFWNIIEKAGRSGSELLRALAYGRIRDAKDLQLGLQQIAGQGRASLTMPVIETVGGQNNMRRYKDALISVLPAEYREKAMESDDTAWEWLGKGLAGGAALFVDIKAGMFGAASQRARAAYELNRYGKAADGSLNLAYKQQLALANSNPATWEKAYMNSAFANSIGKTSKYINPWMTNMAGKYSKVYSLTGDPFVNISSGMIGSIANWFYKANPTATWEDFVKDQNNMLMLLGASEGVAQSAAYFTKYLAYPILKGLSSKLKSNKDIEELMRISRLVDYTQGQILGGIGAMAYQNISESGKLSWGQLMSDALTQTALFGHQIGTARKNFKQINKDLIWREKHGKGIKEDFIPTEDFKKLVKLSDEPDIEYQEAERRFNAMYANEGVTLTDKGVAIKSVDETLPDWGTYVKNEMDYYKQPYTLEGLLNTMAKNKLSKGTLREDQRLLIEKAKDNDTVKKTEVAFEPMEIKTEGDYEVPAVYDQANNRFVFNTNFVTGKNMLHVGNIAKSFVHEVNHRFVKPLMDRNPAYAKEVERFYATVKEYIYDDNGKIKDPSLDVMTHDNRFDDAMKHAMGSSYELIAAFNDGNIFVNYLLNKSTKDKMTFGEKLTKLVQKSMGRRRVEWDLWESFKSIMDDAYNEAGEPIGQNPQNSGLNPLAMSSSSMEPKVTKIISGGQTGVDQLGLKIGKELGYETGGIAPPKFLTEKGSNYALRDEYGLEEISPEKQGKQPKGQFYNPRTQEVVNSSDGVLYFSNKQSAGLVATKKAALQAGKPFILNPTAAELKQWIKDNNISVLNIAGNRASHTTKEELDKYAKIIKEALSGDPIEDAITEGESFKKITPERLNALAKIQDESMTAKDNRIKFEGDEETINSKENTEILSRKEDKNLLNIYVEAGYNNAQEFIEENLGKSYTEIFNNVTKKIRKQQPKISADQLRNKAAYIAMRTQNVEPVIPLRIDYQVNNDGSVLYNIDQEFNTRNLKGNITQEFMGKHHFFDNIFAPQMLDKINNSNVSKTTKRIFTELFKSKKYNPQSFLFSSETGDGFYNERIEDSVDGNDLYMIIKNVIDEGYVPLRTSVWLRSKELSNMMQLPDELKAVKQEEFVYDTRYFSLKNYLAKSSSWNGNKPINVEKILEQINLNVLKNWDQTGERLPGLLPDELKQFETPLWLIIDRYFRGPDGNHEAAEVNVENALMDIFAWASDQSGDTRMIWDDKEQLKEKKYGFKYEGGAFSNSTIMVKDYNGLSDIIKTKVINKEGNEIDVDRIIRNAALTVSGDGITTPKTVDKNIFVFDQWMFTDIEKPDIIINPELAAIANNMILDGGERTINSTFHWLESIITNRSSRDVSTFKHHGTAFDISEKTASHYERHTEYLNQEHPWYARFLKKNKYTISQLANTTSFKNKGYSDLIPHPSYLDPSVTLWMTRDGRWIKATRDNMGIPENSPDDFLKEQLFLQDILKKGNKIPENYLTKIPFASPTGSNFLYASHKSHLVELPLSMDANAGFYKGSFFWNGNEQAEQAAYKWRNDIIDKHLKKIEEILQTRAVLGDYLTKDISDKDSFKGRYLSDKSLISAANVINSIREVVNKEYESTGEDKSWVIHYTPTEVMAMLDEMIGTKMYSDEFGQKKEIRILKPEAIPTLIGLLNGVMVGREDRPAGAKTLIAYMTRDLINSALLARGPGVNLVLQPGGLDRQYLLNGMIKSENKIREQAKREYAHIDDIDERNKLVENKVSNRINKLNDLVNFWYNEGFEPTGELKDFGYGIVISEDALNELNKWNKENNRPELGLFSKVGVNLMPNTGLEGVTGAIILGITDQPGIIRLNKATQSKVFGKDGDFDKVGVTILPASLINHLIDMKIHEGSLTSQLDNLRNKEKIPEGYHRLINYDESMMPAEFDSRPQGKNYAEQKFKAELITDQVIGTKKKNAYFWQNEKITKTNPDGSKTASVFVQDNNSDRPASYIFNMEFTPYEQEKNTYITQMGVDYYNPNHVDKVRSIWTSQIKEIQAVNDELKPIYRINDKEKITEFLMWNEPLTDMFIAEANRMTYKKFNKRTMKDASPGSAMSSMREKTSFFDFGAVTKTIPATDEDPYDSTPNYVANKMRKLTWTNPFSVEQKVPDMWDNTSAELSSILINNKLANRLINEITDTSIPQLKKQINDEAFGPKSKELNWLLDSKLQARIQTILGGLESREAKGTRDNIYEMSEEYPLIAKPVEKNLDTDNWDRRVYLSQLRNIFDIYRTKPGEIEIARYPDYIINMKDGVINYRNLEGKQISEYTDPVTGRTRQIKKINIRKAISEEGQLLVPYEDVKEWLYNPRIQFGLFIDKKINQGSFNKMRTDVVTGVAKLLVDKYGIDLAEAVKIIGFSKLDDKAVQWASGSKNFFRGGSIFLPVRKWGGTDSKKIEGFIDKEAETKGLNKLLEFYESSEAKKKELKKLIFDGKPEGNVLEILAQLKKKGINLTAISEYGEVPIEQYIKGIFKDIGHQHFFGNDQGAREQYGYAMSASSMVGKKQFTGEDLLPKSRWWRFPYIFPQQKVTAFSKIEEAIRNGYNGLDSLIPAKDMKLPLVDILNKHYDVIYDKVVKPLLSTFFANEKIPNGWTNEDMKNYMELRLDAYNPKLIAYRKMSYSLTHGGEANTELTMIKLFEELFSEMHNYRQKDKMSTDRRNNTLLHPFTSQLEYNILKDQSKDQRLFSPDHTMIKLYGVKNGQVVIDNPKNANVSAILATDTELPRLSPIMPDSYVRYVYPLQRIRNIIDAVNSELQTFLQDSSDLMIYATEKKSKGELLWDTMSLLRDFPDLNQVITNTELDPFGNIERRTVDYKNEKEAPLHTKKFDDLIDSIFQDFVNRETAETVDEIGEYIGEIPIETVKENIANDPIYKAGIKAFLTIKTLAQVTSDRIISAAESLKSHSFNMGDGNAIYNANNPEEPSIYNDMIRLANEYKNIDVDKALSILEKTNSDVRAINDVLEDIIQYGENDHADFVKRKMTISKQIDLVREMHPLLKDVDKLLSIRKKPDTYEYLSDPSIPDNFEIGDYVNPEWEKSDTKWDIVDSISKWRSIMDKAIKTNIDEDPVLYDNVIYDAQEGLISDIQDAVFHLQYNLYKEHREKDNTLSYREFITREAEKWSDGKIAYKPIEFHSNEELVNMVRPLLNSIISVSEASANTTGYWYHLMNQFGVPGYEMPWKNLPNDIKKRMREQARSTLTSIIDTFKKKIYDFKSIEDVHYMFGKGDLDIHNVIEDGKWVVKYVNADDKVLNLNLNNLIRAHGRMTEKPDFRIENYVNYSFANFADKVHSRLNDIMNRIEKHNLVDYLYNNKETNIPAHNYTQQQITKGQGNLVFYGTGEEETIDPNQLVQRIYSEGKGSFARPGTPAVIEYVAENGEKKVFTGDLIGHVLRKIEYDEGINDTWDAEQNKYTGKETLNDMLPFVVAYNGIENRLIAVNAKNISNMKLGRLYETAYNKLYTKKKYELFEQHAMNILDSIEKAQIKYENLFEHTGNWLETQEVNNFILPTKGGTGSWKTVDESDSLGQLPYHNKTSPELLNWMNEVAKIDFDMKYLKNNEWAIKQLQQKTMLARVALEYLGLNHLLKAGWALFSGNPFEAGKRLTRFAGRWGNLFFGNLMMTTAGITNKKMDLISEKAIEKRKSYTLWDNFISPFSQVFLQRGIWADGLRNERLSSPNLTGFTRASENSITQFDEFINKHIRELSKPGIQLWKEAGGFISKVAKERKAFEYFFSEVDRFKLADGNIEEVKKIAKKVLDRYGIDIKLDYTTRKEDVGEGNIKETIVGGINPTIHGASIDQYRKFDLSVLDMLTYLASGKGAAQNFEYASAKRAYAAGATQVSLMQHELNRLYEYFGTNDAKNIDDIAMAEYQAIQAKKCIGFYDKAYQRTAWFQRQLDMFKNFRKERQLDRTVYFKNRYELFKMAEMAMKGDKSFIRTIKSLGIPVVPFGGSAMYNPIVETKNEWFGGIVPLYGVTHGLPWVLRLGGLTYATGLFADFNDWFDGLFDNMMFEPLLMPKIAINILKNVLNLPLTVGAKTWPVRTDKKGHSIELNSEQYVKEMNKTTTEPGDMIGQGFGFGPVESRVSKLISYMALFGLHDIYRKSIDKLPRNKYLEQERIALIKMWLDPVATVTSTSPFLNILEQQALNQTRSMK